MVQTLAASATVLMEMYEVESIGIIAYDDRCPVVAVTIHDDDIQRPLLHHERVQGIGYVVLLVLHLEHYGCHHRGGNHISTIKKLS